MLFQVKNFFVVGVGVVVSSQVFLCCGCWSCFKSSISLLWVSELLFKSSISLLWVLELLFQVKYFFAVSVGVVVSSQVFICCGCRSYCFKSNIYLLWVSELLFQVKYFFVVSVGVVVLSISLLWVSELLFQVKYFFVVGVGVVVSSQVFLCCGCWSCCFKSSNSLFHSPEKWTPHK